MRDALAKELLALAVRDERVVMLSGDIGNRLFDEFKFRFPQRFFNCGVAEANLMSMAAGMALCGLRPIAYTITPFITARCLEQIRVDVCYHQAPVTIVGVGAGLSYAGLGATHHACEDIAFLRALPTMKVVCPCDPLETTLGLRAALAQDDPVYLRLGKKGEPAVHSAPPDFRLGKAISMRTGTEVALVSTGTILPNVLAAADLLASQGIAANVTHMHTVKPLDTDHLQDLCARFSLLVTVEEHSEIGGLGGAIAEWISSRHRPPRLVRIGTADAFLYETGGQTHARKTMSLDPQSIGDRVLVELRLGGLG